jgi:molybdenum cofactor biosynthesis enzyme MoaA
MKTTRETVYHVTTLSNFAKAFDKYSRDYNKGHIAQSTYPDQFFVLGRDELDIGFEKANRLLHKLGLSGDRLLVLCAQVDSRALHVNERTGKGRYLASPCLRIDHLYYVGPAGTLEPVIVEEAYAASLAVAAPGLKGNDDIAPRSLSVLPIARACQAACRFCFSESSASLEQVPHQLDVRHVEDLCVRAKARGAERFVITGGGEPGLVPHAQMLELIGVGHRHFKKVVLITNGVHLSRLDEGERKARLADYLQAGLSVLSLSRHHHDAEQNEGIMGLDTRTERVLNTVAANPELAGLRVRLVCVLQTGGIEDSKSLDAYVTWASERGVRELCFKELYVSTTKESAYHANPENQWSLDHQVSLSLITDHFAKRGFAVASRLPWGAPVLTGLWNGALLAVAAYTEPSLFWERSTGIARSWNIMADGQCLVSLEDPTSALSGTGVRKIVSIQKI